MNTTQIKSQETAKLARTQKGFAYTIKKICTRLVIVNREQNK